MHYRVDGILDIIQSLIEVGFHYAPDNQQILYLKQFTSSEMDIHWIWTFSKLENKFPYVTQTNQALMVIQLEVSSKSVYIGFHYGDQAIEFSCESTAKERIIESLLEYYNLSEKPLNSKLIRTIFGKDSFFHLIAMKMMQLSPPHLTSWKRFFGNLYTTPSLDERLYFSQAYLCFLLKFFILQQESKENLSDETFEDILSSYEIPQIHILVNDIFSELIFGPNLNRIFQILIPKLIFSNEDLFAEIFQELITLETRHPLGEVYSPTSLIQIMLEKKIQTQYSFLDPSCGTGTFLIELIKYLSKNNKLSGKIEIFGIDINPLSLLACITNLILQSRLLQTSELPKIYLIQGDALFLKNTSDVYPVSNALSLLIRKRVDFIIGNPPWINISGIYRRDYKEDLKTLAAKLNILYTAESKNTEICTIFFNQTRDAYLKNGGEIFFILPASVLNGRQHGYFRYFPHFYNIEVWRFTEDIFKIHSICLYARNLTEKIEDIPDIKAIKKRLTLSSTLFSIEKDDSLKEIDQKTPLVPLYIKFHNNHIYPLIGRYNPLSFIPKSLQNISPQVSYYYRYVRGGLRIVPRRWVVIKEHPPFDEIVTIHPDLSSQAKSLWAVPPYIKAKVESQYIHAFLKSEFLIPFTFVNVQYAFIPIRFNKKAIKTRSVIIYDDLAPNASKLYQLLDNEYRHRIKESAAMKTLSDNFTYNNRLLPTNGLLQKNQVMVVHNSIGSIVKSAIIRNPILLDNSLYYIILNDIDEAYYLCGILNSSIMTQLVRMIGSTGSRGSLRNIHKNPYNFPIPQYSASKLQLDITKTSKTIESYVYSKIFSSDHNHTIPLLKLIGTKPPGKGPRTIQKNLLTDEFYRKSKNELNTLVHNLFLSETFSRKEI